MSSFSIGPYCAALAMLAGFNIVPDPHHSQARRRGYRLNLPGCNRAERRRARAIVYACYEEHHAPRYPGRIRELRRRNAGEALVLLLALRRS